MTTHPIAAQRPLALAATALLLALAGCAVGPDYQRPATPLPAAYPGQTAAAQAAATLASDWWTLFGSPELNMLVERALSANADIAQAVARVEQSQGLLREANSAFVPTVNANASATRVEQGVAVPTNFSGRPISTNTYVAGLSTSFEIDFWGKLARASESARAQLLAGETARDTVRLTVAGAVTQAWFALRSLDSQIATARSTLSSREGSARLVELRRQAGSASRLEAEQAESARADAALQLRELQRQRAVAESLIGQLTVQPGLALPEAPLAGGPVPVVPAGLPSDLLARRPDVQRAEALLVSANAQIGVAKAAFFPSISLTASGSSQSRDLSALFSGPTALWNLGLGLTAPLFDGGRTAARVDQAGARQREAVGAYQSAVAAAFKETADALVNVKAAREAQADVERRARAATEAERLAGLRTQAGYSGYLELLDAQRSAATAQLELVRNRQAQLNATVDLIKALGGGWQAPTK